MSANSTQVIKFAFDKIPIGEKDGSNLVFEAPEQFITETLQIYLSGLHLDRGIDYFVDVDNKTFTIILMPSDPTRLNVPPLQDEKFSMNYVKR